MSSVAGDRIQLAFCCARKNSKEMEQWLGEVRSISNYGGYVELFIEGRSSIRVICGESKNGFWACIPDYDAGCVLSSLEDTFFNVEKLSGAMRNKVDAITVAEALKALADKGLFNRT